MRRKKNGSPPFILKENLQKFYIMLLFTSKWPDLVIPSNMGSCENSFLAWLNCIAQDFVTKQDGVPKEGEPLEGTQ